MIVYYDRDRKEGREISDEALIKQVLRGNDHAFRLLIEKYQSHIFKLVYSVLKNEKDAEDAAQEVFLKVYYSLPNYEGKGLKTWLSRIAVNYAIDCKRKRDRRHEVSTEDELLQLRKSPNETIEEEVLKSEKYARVHERLNELPDNYRDVVLGFYIQEKTAQQIATELEIKEKTVLVKLHRARNWMKVRWKEDDF